jgi:exopolyphosphatase/guanosine-5'-triphosphate,3'-diphosphate pyrophosphatase
MELAVLDLGSTTFHLQHFQADAQGNLKSCLDLKNCTSLGAQVFADGYIDARSRVVALQAVDDLLKASNLRGFTQRAIVATSAMRSAQNGRALAREIEARHDCQVKILEPREEARLAYLGQLGFPGLAGKRFAMVDLGGGSVELSVGRDEHVLLAESLPLGAVRMRVASAAHGGHGDSQSQLRALGSLLCEQLAEPVRALQRLEPELIVFGSGSARAARKLLLRADQLPGKVGPIVTERFRRELSALYGHTPEQLIALGVEPARSTTVLTSAAIMLQILELSCAKGALISDRGLRDGVAGELLRKLQRVSGVFRSAAPREAAAPHVNDGQERVSRACAR